MTTRFLLDPGHGGIAWGHYLTPGKRSPEVPPGVYEGEYNRAICDRLVTFYPDDFLTIAPGPINVPLKARVSFVNQIAAREPSALFSVHLNAAPGSGWQSARGFVVFHSKKASKRSIILAEIALKHLTARLEGLIEPRSNPIKAANHTITTSTNCPAVLLELGFMTNEAEVKRLESPRTQYVICNAIRDAGEEFRRLYG